MESNKPVVVIGGGVSGLSFAWQLLKRESRPVIVLEKQPEIGGLCATVSCHGHRADIGPHKIFSVLPGVVPEILSLFGRDDIIEHEKRNRLYLFGNYLEYPLQLANLFQAVGPFEGVRMGISYACSALGSSIDRSPDVTYEQYVCRRFGRRIYQRIFYPLASKVWGDPSTLSADIARTRIPASGGMDVIMRLLHLTRERRDTNARIFHYPKNGFGEVPNRMARQVTDHGGIIHVKANDITLHVSGGEIGTVSWTENGTVRDTPVSLVAWTAPLSSLHTAISGRDVSILKSLSECLPSRHVIVVYLVFRTQTLTRDHWVFTPDPSIPFSRLYEPRQLSWSMSPEGETAIACDMTSADGLPPWTHSDTELSHNCLLGLERMGITNESTHLIGSCVKRYEYFYPRYTGAYRATIDSILQSVASIPNLLLTGRQGLYNYSNLDHCVWMSMEAASLFTKKHPVPSINRHLLNSSLTFRIVD